MTDIFFKNSIVCNAKEERVIAFNGVKSTAGVKDQCRDIFLP